MFVVDICWQCVSWMCGFCYWKWYVDEVYVIKGEIYYLWCVVDYEGEILESYVIKK